MKLYLNQITGEVHGFEADQQYLIDDQFRPLTEIEEYQHLNPPMTQDDAILQKKKLLKLASDEMAPLQDAIDLDKATNEEIKKLENWKNYRVMLNRIEVALAPDIEWPQRPE
ncbi:tail fiber assembly protein [Proteus mirabilis]|nr:tail fiber assembly protein [Proteus mirabilis]